MDDRRQKRPRRPERSSSPKPNDRKKARLPSPNGPQWVRSAKNRDCNGPSRVVHIRNISSGIEETDVIQLGLPFGKVSNILMLKQKNQAFLEFERESSAKTMVDYFENSSPPMICGRTVFIQFSQYRELKTDASHSNANAKTQAALKAARTVLDNNTDNRRDYSTGDQAGRILHVTVENLVYPVELKTLALIFNKYGHVDKILTFTKNNLFQALIQYERSRDAEEARYALNGQNVYNGCCNLQIQRSRLTRVDVKYNDDVGWDFNQSTSTSRDDHRRFNEIRPGDSYGGRNDESRFFTRSEDSAAARRPPDDERGSVLLVSNLEAGRLTPDQLFTLFGVYGDVVRVKILFNKKDTAMIQFAEAQMADTARQFLDKLPLHGKVLSVSTSKHSRVVMPKEDGVSEKNELTKDFTHSPLHRYKKAGSKNCGNIFKPSSTLHLSNIADGVTENDLVNLFKRHGEVVRFKFFNGTQKMAVIAMSSTEESIEALIHAHNHPFNKHHLRVSFSKSPLKA